MQISLDPLLKEYDGIPLRIEELPQYDQYALQVFTNYELVDDPYLISNFMHNISVAKKTFEGLRMAPSSATLSTFLLWCAAKSLCQVRHLSWRKFGNAWYEFRNPPFFFPVATGKASRFAGVILKNVANSSFEEFSKYYRTTVDEAIEKETSAIIPFDMFLLAHNIVNIPHLRFTGLKLHTAQEKSTNVTWIFGQRYEESGSFLIPMMIRSHHANGDPVIFQTLIRNFDRMICGEW